MPSSIKLLILLLNTPYNQNLIILALTFDSRAIPQPRTQIVSCHLHTSGKHWHTYDTYHCVTKMNMNLQNTLDQMANQVGWIGNVDRVQI